MARCIVYANSACVVDGVKYSNNKTKRSRRARVKPPCQQLLALVPCRGVVFAPWLARQAPLDRIPCAQKTSR